MTRPHALTTFARCLCKNLTHTMSFIYSMTRDLDLRPNIRPESWGKGTQWR